jgi:predicted MFS family arabinose efflux permease
MVTPLLPVFRDALGVDLSRLSLAIAWRSIAGAASPFLAFIADNRGRKTGMLFGLVLFTAGVSTVIFIPTFNGFAIALVLSAMGKYVFDPAMQAYLGDQVPYEQRGTILAITELSWSGSFFIGTPIAAFVIARWGWIAPFPLLGILGLAAIVILVRLVPNDESRLVKGPSFASNMRAVFTSRPAIAAIGLIMFLSASNEVVNMIVGVWLNDSFGLEIAALGMVAAVIGLSELSGEGLVTFWVDRLGKKRAVGIGLLAINLTALLLPIIGQSLVGAFIGLFLYYISFEFAFVSSIPMMSEIIPSARATLMAFIFASASLGRAFAALIAVPLYEAGLWYSALMSLVLNMAALFILRRLKVAGE